MAPATVRVSRKGAERIQRGHPWVFRTDVTHADGVAPGALVRVADPRGRPLGFAFFSSRSEIRLRMVSRQPELAEGFLKNSELIIEATSFGGVHTTAERRARWGGDKVSEGFIRLSVGCEDAQDLVDDFEQALDGLTKAEGK